MSTPTTPSVSSVPEVLAPAGGRAQFFAALNAGADAVFLGLKAFNARSRAENFTPEDLRELVPLAHAYGMKVLVTVNVLVKEGELRSLVPTLATLEEIGVDAIIVQDLAVARIATAYFPRLRLHASTQMAVHNLAGVRAARRFGFRRVVLARELTAVEIKRIRERVSRDEVELEAFCHGSLCYSYSGLCFFSGAEDARSGNRGECAYTCRQPYKIVSEEGHGFLFSMRDLDTASSLELLVKGGVDTLKIEGRKKDAQYVASTVRLYRQRLDEVFGRSTLRAEAPRAAIEASEGADASDVRQDLALSFHRRTTSFFLEGRYHENVIDLDNPTHQGIEIGRVEQVRGRWVTLRASTAVERFDGVRVSRDARDLAALDAKYENQRLEFSLRELRLDGKRAFAAPAGARIEIEVPDEPGGPTPRIGDLVHKTRSADLKRRVERLSEAPADAKLREWREIDGVHVTAGLANALLESALSATGGELVLTAVARKFGEVVAAARLVVPAVRATGAADLARDLEGHLTLFGDAGFRCKEMTFEGERTWFVPRRLQKELKNLLAAKLTSGYDALVRERLTRAVEGVCTAVESRGSERAASAAVAIPQYAVKSDRLETLADAIVEARRLGDEFSLSELVFEPKRAFLPDLDPGALAARLVAMGAEAGVPVRIALPTVIRAWDEPLLKRWLQAAAAAGLTRYELGNVGAFELLREWGLAEGATDLAGDFTLYALNSCTTAFWREQGLARVCLSIEDDLQNLTAQMTRLDTATRASMQAILFKDTPLFIAEACSLTALHNGCPTSKVCGYRTLEIENPKGERFFVAHESCKSIVYGRDAYSLTHRQDALLALGVSLFRLDFLTRSYDRAGVGRVLAAAMLRESLDGTHSANFERTLL